MQTRSRLLLASHETITTLVHAGGTKLLQMRCHGQLSRTCVPNLSCDYISQSCSVKAK